MAVFSVYPLSPLLLLYSASRSDLENLRLHFSAPSLPSLGRTIEEGGPRGVGSRRFVALSTHSNPRILKRNRKSRFGETLSPYDSDEEDSFEFDEEEDDDEDEDDWFDDVSSSSSHRLCLCSMRWQDTFELYSPCWFRTGASAKH